MGFSVLLTDFHSCRGAVKSNIGHLEGASGIAGVIKTILTLERAVIPPNANFRCINPKIDPDHLLIKVKFQVIGPSNGKS